MLLATSGTIYTLPRVDPDTLFCDTLRAIVADVDSLHVWEDVDMKGGVIVRVGTTRWDDGTSDLIEALSLSGEATLDTEWDTWAELPTLANGYILKGDGSSDATAVLPTALFPFDPDSSIYGTAEIGEAAGDTLVTAWKSGAVTGDLVICGWVDHPLNSVAGSAIINARVVGSKQVQITRYPAVSMTSGGHTVWYLVIGRP
jgi:hypothetical protein